MDKLRAIEYFNRAVETGSFAAAARSLDVTTPAVTQSIAALERTLGIALFHRNQRGLTLTADGERYHATSRRVAADLDEIERQLSPRGAKPRGTLTVGMRPALGQNCVMPRIQRFLASFPEVELVLKPVNTFQEIEGRNLDLLVLAGWAPERDFVMRPLAQTRLLVCASPEYWARAGRPGEPEALRGQHCLVYRGTPGVILDQWSFEKNGERRTVDVHGRLVSDERLWLEEAACAGAGVIRVPDLTVGRYLATGLLVPVLTDWMALEAPMIYAAYPPRHRQSRLVRVFLDFLVKVFGELESTRTPAPAGDIPRMRKPQWVGRAHGRQSAYTARSKRSPGRG